MDAPATPRGPASVEWRVHISKLAMWFFHWDQDVQLTAIGKEKVSGKLTHLSGADFIGFLTDQEGESYWPLVPQVERILRNLVRAGLISISGFGSGGMTVMSTFLTVGGASKSQQGGDLWLAEAVGRDLLLDTYGPLTVAVPGLTSKGDATWTSRAIAVIHPHVIAREVPSGPLRCRKGGPTPGPEAPH